MAWVKAGIAVVGTAASMFSKHQANKKLKEMEKNMPTYAMDESIKKRLGLSQTLLNARMPGAAAAERNIYQTQANQMAGAQRGATSGNELLLAGSGAAAQAGQQFGALNQAENADYQRRYGNVSSATDAMAAEKQAEFANKMQNYQQSVAMEGARQANTQQAISQGTQLGMGLGSMAQQGAFGGGGSSAGSGAAGMTNAGSGGAGMNNTGSPFASYQQVQTGTFNNASGTQTQAQKPWWMQ
jgi:hypothetical protein